MSALRVFDSLPFDTIGEGVLWPNLRGVENYTSVGWAQRCLNCDRQSANIMMDAIQLYPCGSHPSVQEKNRNWNGKAKHTTSAKCNPTYYLIDSQTYDLANGPFLESPVRGGNKTALEFQAERYYQLHDPCPTDVYYLGNLGKVGFEFMQPLVTDMASATKRLTMDEVALLFEEIGRSLSVWKFRARPVPPEELGIVTFFCGVPRWSPRIGYIL
ncbi:hypothetical protein DFH09DRAFT_1080768 [Mycena vulgaris]|nr:hypothetical protein DFH09DRAFT_1080768 [Mycena vulgaris]